jgi:hypothetical protein
MKTDENGTTMNRHRATARAPTFSTRTSEGHDARHRGMSESVALTYRFSAEGRQGGTQVAYFGDLRQCAIKITRVPACSPYGTGEGSHDRRAVFQVITGSRRWRRH